jgi:hypothetical protein
MSQILLIGGSAAMGFGALLVWCGSVGWNWIGHKLSPACEACMVMTGALLRVLGLSLRTGLNLARRPQR